MLKEHSVSKGWCEIWSVLGAFVGANIARMSALRLYGQFIRGFKFLFSARANPAVKARHAKMATA
jgi:hypothetical protein